MLKVKGLDEVPGKNQRLHVIPIAQVNKAGREIIPSRFYDTL